MTEEVEDGIGASRGMVFPIAPFTRRDWGRVLATLGLVLGSFGLVGSVLLVYYTRSYPESDVIQLPGGLILRAVAFALISVASLALLWRLREGDSRCPVTEAPQAPSRWAWVVLAILLLATVVLLCSKIGRYPWAAPDEVHHLNVARNLAIHGAYASGRPGAFNYFDSFDSVGPAVLGPIAVLFELFGVSLATARGTMVCFFLLLCAAAFGWCRRLYGTWAGVASVGFLVGAFSSIYLGRTVYGEVPAFAYLLGGLLAWQRSMSTTQPVCWGLVAGALVACAVLSKTIVVLVLFSFMGAWVYDRITFRSIRWVHVVVPAVGGIVVLALWSLIQRFHGTEGGTTGSVLDIYQHYLLFGLESVPFALSNSILPNPGTHGVWAVVGLVSIPLVFRHRYAASAVVLYLYAVFMLYWWYFFTPGQIHRYLWNAYAILAMFSAPWLVHALRAAGDALRRPLLRGAYAVAVVCLVLPAVHWVSLQVIEIGSKEEMTTEFAVLEAIAALPSEKTIATTSGRLPGVLNFFADQSIGRGFDAVELLADYDVVIAVDTPEFRASLPPEVLLQALGEFVLLSRAAPDVE